MHVHMHMHAHAHTGTFCEATRAALKRPLLAGRLARSDVVNVLQESTYVSPRHQRALHARCEVINGILHTQVSVKQRGVQV